jgi:hypothetical protein
MQRLALEQVNEEALLHLDSGSRRRLAGVLEDWLTAYAGVQPVSVKRENFDLVVEVRRVLLQPDELVAD